MIKRSNSLRELSDDQLHCHLYRHDFSEPEIYLETYPQKIQRLDGYRNGWVMIHKCRKCGAQRFDYVRPETYDLWDRKYWYNSADGYLVSFPATTQDYRAEIIRRRRIRMVDTA